MLLTRDVRIGQQQAGAGVVEQVLLLGYRQRGTHAHPNGSEPLRGQKRNHQLRTVRERDRDPLAFTHAEVVQDARCSVHRLIQCRP
jgi:hypothetical protein